MNRLLGQSFTHVTVRRLEKKLLAESTLLAGGKEAKASLLVRASDFKVREALFQVMGDPEDHNCRRQEIEGLRGLIAYPGSGGAFKGALEGWPEAAGRLFMEAIKGLLQAETFVLEERGFPSGAAYDAYFAARFAGSCAYYSNFTRELRQFSDYVNGQQRGTCLFNRIIFVAAEAMEKGFLLRSGMNDSFHSMALEIIVDPDGRIGRAKASMMRYPDPICLRGEQAVAGLTGQRLDLGARGDLAGAAGGGLGCTHLIDLTLAAANLARETIKKEEGLPG